MENTMRELNFKEVEEVSGGVWFFTPWAVKAIAATTGAAFLTRVIVDTWGDGPRGPTPPAIPVRR